MELALGNDDFESFNEGGTNEGAGLIDPDIVGLDINISRDIGNLCFSRGFSL